MHSGCTSFNIGNDGRELGDVEDDLIQLLRDFMDWIYKQLETEYDYKTSREQIIETIKANDYEFDEDGDQV